METNNEEIEYDAEYDKAWGDEEPQQEEKVEEEDLEQPESESEVADELPEEEVVEDSIPEEEVVKDDEESKDSEETDFAEVLKWKGKEIPVTRDELIALGQKGFDAEKKWQEAAINRPIKELVDKYGFTAEQLEMFGNITKDKNAEALALLAQQNDIDLYDAEHKNYKPVVENKNYELDDVVAEINENEEIATQMNDYVSSVPQSIKDKLVSEPAILRGLNYDMKEGIAQKIMPEVIKQLAINPNQDFVKLYQDVGTRLLTPSEPEAVQEAPRQPKATREDKQRVAVSKKAPAQEKNIADDYDAAWDDNAHFEAVRRRLQGF
jgi:hypothetical protein